VDNGASWSASAAVLGTIMLSCTVIFGTLSHSLCVGAPSASRPFERILSMRLSPCIEMAEMHLLRCCIDPVPGKTHGTDDLNSFATDRSAGKTPSVAFGTCTCMSARVKDSLFLTAVKGRICADRMPLRKAWLARGIHLLLSASK
jgi:hypothetical protein